MTIRKVSLSISTALAVLIIAVLSFDLIKMQQDRMETEGARISSIMLSNLSSILSDLSDERNLTQLALGHDEPASHSTLATIGSVRLHAGEKLDALKAAIIEASWITDGAVLIEGIDKSLDVLGLFRDEANVQMSLPMAERDESRVLQLPGDFTNIMISVRQIAAALRPSDLSVPNQMVFLERLEDQTWNLLEFGGRERALLAAIIANPSSAPMNTGLATQMIDRAVIAWQEIQPYFNDEKLPAEILQQLTQVRDIFFDDYWYARDEVTYLAQMSEPFPLTSEAFLQQSAPAMRAIEELMAVIEREKVNFWAQRAQDQSQALFFYAAVAAIGLILCGFFLYYMQYRVTGRINAMTGLMSQLAGGDTAIDLTKFFGRNELGRMADAVQVFRENADRVSELTAEREAQQKQHEEALRQEMMEFADSLEREVKKTVASVEEKSTEMRDVSQKMAEVVHQVQDQSQLASSASMDSVSNMELVSDAAIHLTSSIESVGRSATDALSMSQTAVEKAKATNQTVDALKQAGMRIGAIVGIINDIAKRTNLLALNATIEASRAGDAGKGFSVVASEVKSLANQTVGATDGVAEQIATIQNITDQAVTAIGDISETINQMSTITEGIAGSVEQQENDTNNIASTVSDVTSGSKLVNDKISSVSEISDESRRLAMDVDAAATMVAEDIARLQETISQSLQSLLRSRSRSDAEAGAGTRAERTHRMAA